MSYVYKQIDDMLSINFITSNLNILVYVHLFDHFRGVKGSNNGAPCF